MTEKRHKLRHQILEDRINNSDNLWFTDCISKNSNITWEIIKNNPTIPWNWPNISENKNITWDIILNNLDKPWFWDLISLNKNITWDIIINNLDCPWDWNYLSRYKPITWCIIKQNINLFKQRLNWNLIGSNLKFDFEILKNLGLTVPWNFQNLSRSNIINWDIVIKYKDQDWDWDALSNSRNLDYNIILEHINQAWNWDSISFNLKITSQVLSTNQNLNYYILSFNKSITEEILIDHKDKPWNYVGLSSNCQNISKEFVLNNPDKPWNYDLLAYKNIIIMDKISNLTTVIHNTKLPLEFIKENIDLFTTDQQWRCLSKNENLNFDFILDNLDKSLDWSAISSSDYITYEIVNNNRNLPWNWRCLTVNKNMLDIKSEFKLKAREHIAAYKIQQYWLRDYYNPEYLICQQRLSREFKSLTKA
jgi:hypothetical protein